MLKGEWRHITDQFYNQITLKLGNPLSTENCLSKQFTNEAKSALYFIQVGPVLLEWCLQIGN